MTTHALSKKLVGAIAFVAALACLVAALPTQGATGVPKLLSYQGRLYDAVGNLLGGAGTTYCFRFSIYDDPAAGTKMWPTGTPNEMTSTVRLGVFSLMVGDTTRGGDALTYNFQDSDTAYLNVEVATTTGSCGPFQALLPRQRITATGYALNAGTVGGYVAAQNASGSQLPVLSSGNLTLGGVNPQVNATGTNTLTFQGGAGTGNIQFFNASNYVTATGTAALIGDLIIGGATALQGVTFANATTTGNIQAQTLNIVGGSALQGFTFANATGTGNLQLATLKVTGAVDISSTLNVTGATGLQGLTFANASGTGNFSLLGQATFGAATSSGETVDIVGSLGVESPAGTNILLSNSSTPLYLKQAAANSTGSLLKIDNFSDIEQFRVGSDGSVFANGFIAKQMQFSDEFFRTHANVTADAAGGGTTGQGDNFNWGATEMGTCTWSSLADTLNGVNRQAITANGGCLTYLSAAARNANLALNVGYKPIIVMKVLPSVVSSTNRIMAGMSDDATTSSINGVPPVNGVYFSNEAGTTWIGVTRAANTQDTVTCTGQTISTSQYAYFRISVLNSSSVEFFMDNDTSNGINTTSCGVITSTSTIPQGNLAAFILNQRFAGGVNQNIDVDFVRINQDDPIVYGATTTESSPDIGAGADIAEEIHGFEPATLGPGDVVKLLSSASATVAKSDLPYATDLYGVITTDPGQILGNGLEDSVRIALAGRVPVKVNASNGPIAIGDWLTSSEEPGVAMKATHPGMVIGRAMENFTGATSTTAILTSVETQFWNGSAYETRTELPSNVFTAATEIASRAAEGFRSFVLSVADAISTRVAYITQLFLKDATIVPGGSVTVPSGANQLAGQDVLPGGMQEIFISNTSVGPDSKIFLTPTTAVNAPLSVVAKVPGQGFRIRIATTQTTDAAIDWLIVQSYAADGTPPTAPVTSAPSTNTAPPPVETPPPAPSTTDATSTPPSIPPVEGISTTTISMPNQIPEPTPPVTPTSTPPEPPTITDPLPPPPTVEPPPTEATPPETPSSTPSSTTP